MQAARSEQWYRNGWVWLVIAIPALTVVGCMLTVWLAVVNPVVLVQDPVPASVPATATPRDALPRS